MLTQTFRDVMPKAKALGSRVVEQLDDIIAQFAGLWSVQHKDSGAHGDVTADSLIVYGDLTIGGDVIFEGDILGEINLGPSGEDNHIGGVLVGPDTFTTYDEYPSISVTADAQRLAVEIERDLIPDTDGTGYLGWVGSGAFVRRWRSLYFSDVVYGPRIVATEAFFERGRDVAVGEWQDQAFDASHYFGGGGMTWTVDATAFQYSRYTIVGKTLYWKIYIAWFTGTSTVGGVPDPSLCVTLPGGLAMPSQSWINAGNPFVVNSAYPVTGFGNGLVQFNSTTSVAILLPGFANWAAGSAGVAFTLTIELA